MGSTWTCAVTADDLGKRSAGTSGMRKLLVAMKWRSGGEGKSGEATSIEF